MSSSDEDKSEFEDDEKETDVTTKKKKKDPLTVQKYASPNAMFRFVTRLNGHHSVSKMRSDQEIRSQVVSVLTADSPTLDITEIVHDSDDENHDDDNDVQIPDVAIRTVADLNDIRQKTLEYDQKQIKGIQFANAGDKNLKVVNDYAINSSTCTLI